MRVACSSQKLSTCSRTETRMHQIPREFFLFVHRRIASLIHLKRTNFEKIISVYNKTLEYVKMFAKFTTTDSASAVRE